MRLAEEKDTNLIVDMISDTFKDNKSILYLTGEKKGHLKRIKYLAEYSLKKGFLFGDVFLSDDRKACAVLIDPKKEIISFKSILLDIKLVFQVLQIVRVPKAWKREKIIKSFHPKDKSHIHFWFLSTSRKNQGKGIGTKLIKEIKEYYNGRVIYFETSTKRNLNLYDRLGSNKIAIVDLKEYKLHIYNSDRNV